MQPYEKVRRILGERRISQTELRRLIEEETGQQVSSGRMSQILDGTDSMTVLHGKPISIVLDISLDWLYDDAAKMPPLKRSEKGVVLSAAQAKILEYAENASALDPEPDKLERAKLLLTVGRVPRKPSEVTEAPTSNQTTVSGLRKARKKAGSR